MLRIRFCFSYNLLLILKTYLYVCIFMMNLTDAGRHAIDQKQLQEDFEKSKRTTPLKEDIYMPYWAKGHWVFDRYKMGKSRHPTVYNLQTGYTHNHECNQPCFTLYVQYGKICGQRMATRNSNFKFHYQEFESMCHLEYANCRERESRLDWWPIHEGGCPELKSWINNPVDNWYIKNRVKQWENRIKPENVDLGVNKWKPP